MKRILIVDDQEEIRDLVRMALEIDGYDVHEAVDGEAGLRAVQRCKPDLVLLDVMMPGAIDGLALCRTLKQGPTPVRAKVVMLSARTQPQDQRAGQQAGADAYLVKPFSPRQLLQVVSRMV